MEFEPAATGWEMQTIPWSNGDRPYTANFLKLWKDNK